MRRTISCLTPGLATPLLVLMLPGLSLSSADNTVESLRLVTQENFSRLVLAMERQPRFRVDQVDERRLFLGLGDVRWPLNQNLASVEDSHVKKLALFSQDGKVKGLEITLARPLREIKSFWRAGANELDLDIYLLTEAEGHTGRIEATESQTDRVIKGVPLGTHPEFSRVVLELSEKRATSCNRVQQTG